MKTAQTLSVIGIYCLFHLFLMPGCSSIPGKDTHKVLTVEIKQMQFQPAALTVKKNDTVLFVNHDVVTHNVTEESGKAWSSSSIAAGKSWWLVVTQSAGYYCAIHPVMKGRLTVQ